MYITVQFVNYFSDKFSNKKTFIFSFISLAAATLKFILAYSLEEKKFSFFPQQINQTIKSAKTIFVSEKRKQTKNNFMVRLN